MKKKYMNYGTQWNKKERRRKYNKNVILFYSGVDKSKWAKAGLMGDFNGRVGKNINEIVGPYEKDRNDN